MSSVSGAEIWVGMKWCDITQFATFEKRVREYFPIPEDEVLDAGLIIDLTRSTMFDYSIPYDSSCPEEKIFGMMVKTVEWGSVEISLGDLMKEYQNLFFQFQEIFGIAPKLYLTSHYL